MILIPLVLLAAVFPSAVALHTTEEPGLRTCQAPGGVKGNDVTVVTYVTADHAHHAGFNNFARSLARFGYNYVNVGEGRSDSLAKLWKTRAEAYARYAAQQPVGKVLVFTDAFDVLFQREPGELVAKYRKSGHAIVFAAERLCDTIGCTEDPEAKGEMERLAGHGTLHKYLNAGTMVATAREAAGFLQAVSALQHSEGVDDQTAAVRLMTRNGNIYNVGLDYKSEMFGVVSPAAQHFEEDWETTGRGELVRRGGGRPVALHFAGMGYEGAGEEERFTPCQRHQVGTYNKLIGEMEVAAGRGQKQKGAGRRVVVSMTTTPLRIGQLQGTLDSLLAQTHVVDRIYLNVPRYSQRFGREYVVPEYLKKYARVTVLRCEDYGPATKLIPVLRVEKDPETMIVTVDDEYRYPSQMVATLVQQMEAAPHAAYGFAGQNVERDAKSELGVAVRSVDVAAYHKAPQAVDVLEGFLGAGYLRRFFDEERFSKVDPLCWTTDDIWVAQHLAERGIPRVKLPMPFARPTETENDKLGPLREENVHSTGKNAICAQLVQERLTRGKLVRAEPCAVQFRVLEGVEDEGRTIGGVAPWWTPQSTESPCNFGKASKEFLRAHAHTREFAVLAAANCTDGMKNGDETGVDCGGSCTPCATCSDGLSNGDETGIDCGGSCEPCGTPAPRTPIPTTEGEVVRKATVKVVRFLLRLIATINEIRLRLQSIADSLRALYVGTCKCRMVCQTRVVNGKRTRMGCYSCDGQRVSGARFQVMSGDDLAWEMLFETNTEKTTGEISALTEEAGPIIAVKAGENSAYISQSTIVQVEEVDVAVPVTPSPSTSLRSTDDSDDDMSTIELALLICCCVLGTVLIMLVCFHLFCSKKKHKAGGNAKSVGRDGETQSDNDGVHSPFGYETPSKNPVSVFSQSPRSLSRSRAGNFASGEMVSAQYLDGAWYPAKIRGQGPDGTYSVDWDDGTFSHGIPQTQLVSVAGSPSYTSHYSQGASLPPPAFITGEAVEALYDGSYHRGIVAAVDDVTQCCNINWEDGTHSLGVPFSNIRKLLQQDDGLMDLSH